MKILLLFYTRTGHTLEAAHAVAEGIRSAGAEVDLVNTDDFNAAQLPDYRGLIVGSPCWAGSVSRHGVAMPITRVLAALPEAALSGLRGGGISVHSGFGGRTTVGTIGKILTGRGCTDYHPGPAARAGSPFSLWKGPAVRDEDLAAFRAYGEQFAGID